MSDKLKELMSQPLSRAAQVSVESEDERTISLSFSSENPVEDWPGVATILSHDKGAVDLKRLNDGAPFLFNHNRNDPIGVVESAEIAEDRKGRAVVRLGKGDRAEAMFQDIKDGILRHISVNVKLREVRFESEDGEMEIYRATKWEPFEISLVTIPADTSVGINRELKIHHPMPKENSPEPAPATPEPKVSVEVERQAGVDNERARIREINSAGEQFGEAELARQCIVEGKTLVEFKDAVLERRNKQHNKAVKQNSQPLGMTEREVQDYSFLKVIRHLTDPTNKKLREEAAFEIECGSAVEREGKTERGFFIPVDVLTAPMTNVKRGTNIIGIKADAGYTGTGGALVDTTLLSSSFIDLLRNRSFVMRHATTLGGLVGDIDIPKELTAMSTAWLGEDDEAPVSDVDFGTIGLRNKTVAARGQITRKMIKQSSLDVEAMVRRSIAMAIALEIDRAALYGDGTSNQPIGILNTNNINAVVFAAAGKPTYAELVDMETQVAADNADIGSMFYALAAVMRGHCKTTEKFDGTNGQTIWESGNTINGYATEVSNQVAAADVVFGNFAQLFAGLWGGLELTVDPYTDSARGRINLTSFQDADFEVARPECFCLGRSA